MSKRLDPRISSSRMWLQNPYAHMEELEECWQAGNDQNRYRFARSEGEAFSAKKSHSFESIEARAKELQRAIWKKRTDLGLSKNVHPIDVLDPRLAAELLGFELTFHSSLGWMTSGRRRVSVAGLINQSNRSIQIATDADPRVMRFTAAHEIGHAILHPDQTGLHRDQPLSGIRQARSRTELEADKFATYFLLPDKLLTEEFKSRFLGIFTLNEQTAFALFSKPIFEVIEVLPTLRHVSRRLASSIYYNGSHFASLSESFGVSIEAMAIRLEELKLVIE
ncbi:ImmA/IrrE family metallo-endopeptidase [Xanthomonas phaseoli pv. dieffenbachiae]|nr:ImmA/IrrE family metallo-endopeptidase [Xanthomonas phaseoli pv. dieffenbachiae]MBO9778039.1 ImmA/IrrE family metallo-endopeptidase [Xanthomonas phaseoli pv. dieffenbachiae]MBO9779662.1 ImmA/IrrE family metallo-endopeptidase [Xanthomonas phaseoli pv. dieffenbachiae]MBO9798201.1 ImmA/IrrE family metallo-endopeptidase [Xanthomonas phaseoli pv. dieffenbachiae]MBO9801302.1 ImmA/IrrE family metallo-endopeptidase [Xanthomonas phaseoli pv. dieffenbachiae]